MKYKLIVLDVDGTVYDYHDKMIHPSTMEAIRDAKEAGIYIALATARSYAELNTTCQQEMGVDYFICASGQSILDGQRRSLYAERFTQTQVERLKGLCVQYDAGLTLKYDHLNCLYRHPAQMREIYGNIGESACETLVCESMDHHYRELPIGFSIRGENGIRDQLATALSAYPRDYRLELFRNGIVADVFLSHVSKVTALAYLCRRTGIEAGEVMTFGDSLNDMEMIRWAGLGVAMGNGRDELKQQADHVCAEGWKDGIANTIRRFAL